MRPAGLAVLASLCTCACAAAQGSKDTAQLVRDTRSAQKASLVEVDSKGNPIDGAEKGALQAEKVAEDTAKDLADGPAKLENALGGAVGMGNIAQTKMPESSEAKGEAGKITEDLNVVNSLEDKVEASILHKMTDGKNKAACDENVFLMWDAGIGDGVCVLHAWVLVAMMAGWGAFTGGIWWIVCKGKGRSKTAWDEGQLNAAPFRATGICGCFSNLKPLAIGEATFCNFFMWAETMIRSGTMPWVIVAAVGGVVWLLAPFVHSLGLVYCMFRFVGRFKLRQKLESSEEQHEHEAEETGDAFNDCIMVACCGPCAVAQEAEYLELRANEGQPAPDGADLRHLLEHFTEKGDQGDYAAQQSW